MSQILLKSVSARRHSERGQILIIVLLALVVLSILVPVMVLFVQNEAKWTSQGSRNTNAFHLADAGTDKTRVMLTFVDHSGNPYWNQLMHGGASAPISNFHFDTAFTDLPGGEYAVDVTSGPLAQEVTVTTVARDSLKKETRAITVTMINAPLANTALYSVLGATVTAVQAEWGAVASPSVINVASGACNGGPCHPQFLSSSAIYPWSVNPPSTCDSPNCVQWHTFITNIPQSPSLDFVTYKSSAQATGTYSLCSPTCNFAQAGTDGLGYTNYYDGNLTIPNTQPLDIVGNLIVMGNLTYQCGSSGTGSVNMVMPQTAWKQYGNDWAYYLANYAPTCDPTAPGVFPGLNSSHLSTAGCTFLNSNLDVQGLLYVAGNVTDTCTGAAPNRAVYGIMFVTGNTNITRSTPVKLYYNPNVTSNMLLTQPVLNTVSWQEVNQQWPSGLP